MKRKRVSDQSVPWWAYLLFLLLAAFVLYRIFQHRASEAKAAQPPMRPVLVAKVIIKDVPLYLDEIGTCAAYETVQRSEERRVGKECRSLWAADHEKKKRRRL